MGFHLFVNYYVLEWLKSTCTVQATFDQKSANSAIIIADSAILKQLTMATAKKVLVKFEDRCRPVQFTGDDLHMKHLI
jgi:hypothetical protein